MRNYGESIKEQRLARELTLKDLENKTGINNGNISRWERNEVLPNIDFCVQLAKFYGITLDELVGISDDFGVRSAPTAGVMGESLTASERKLLSDFRQLSPYLQGIALNTVRGLTGAGEGDLHKNA